MISLSLYAQEEHNYTKTYRARVPLDGSISSEEDVTRVNEVTRFYDGLGRPVQTVQTQASPSGLDIISFLKYDGFGRVDKNYLPYAHSSQDNGSFIDPITALEEQQSFHTSKHNSQDGDHAYSQSIYEPSPLNRVIKQLPPGQSWAGSERGITYQYQVNSDDDKVIAWEVLEDGFKSAQSAFYGAGELRKNIVIDENGNETHEYVDKTGRTVLKEVESDKQDYPFYRTYYIYDDLDRLSFVLPPIASQIVEPYQDEGEDGNGGYWIFIDEETRITNATLEGRSFPLTIWVKEGVKVDLTDPFTVSAINDGDLFVKFGLPPNSPQAVKEMGYQYRYDYRNRMIAKKVPDTDWLYMVYDQWDRLVLTQDGNQRENDQWLFTSYDALNRPVITGFITDARSQEALQNYVMGLSDRSVTFDGSGVHGYDAKGYPFTEVTPETILSVTYYDTYDFLKLEGWDDFDFKEELSILEEEVLEMARGQVTGSKQLILGTETFLNSSVFYDYKYRLVQTKAHDPQLNITRTTSEYDFVGNLTASKTSYTGLFEKDINKWFTYDHMDRLKTVEMRIGEEEQSRVTLQENNYNEIGELMEKNVYTASDNVLQSLDFNYNIQGWLTTINRPDLTDDGSDEYESTDIFGMELMYDKNESDEFKQYNGNIGQVNWKQAYADATSRYRYIYDPLNRLKAADYARNNAFSVNKFDVSDIKYDANGNILALNRKADSNTDMDLLKYTYYDGSNRLKNVVDDGDGSNGFKDGITAEEEYTYDMNGNMRTDANKGISMIKYNHLNLPEVVEMGNVRIEYDYLADGTKLTNRVIKGEETTTRLYQNGMVFKNGVLDHILTEEGKVVPFIPGNDDLLDYQYFIKDHLGNVRSVVREQRIYEYLATMETENAEAEESQFSNIAETRQQDVAHSYNGDEFVVTDNSQPLGPVFALNVNKGDVVNLSVFGKVVADGGETVAVEGILSLLYNLMTGTSMPTGETATAVSDGLEGGLVFLAEEKEDDDPGPGYLNYLLFDEDFGFITGGYTPVTSTSYTENTIEAITIDEPGYLITYLSYESSDPDRVFFDDFSITLETSTVIQQENYYPFGLTFNSWNGGDPNYYKYNGFEEQAETGWYDYLARQYDPALGRFLSVDPLSEVSRRFSTYAYALDNPIRFIDPDGMYVTTGDQDPEKQEQETSVLEQLLTNWYNYFVQTGELHDNLFGDGEASDEENLITGFTFYVDVLASHLEMTAIDLAGGSPSGEKAVAKADDVPNVLYRGDSRSPATIFNEGFQSQGDNLNLFDHANATFGTENSAYVSTSKSKQVASDFAGDGGYIYEIDANKVRGVDVNNALGGRSPHPNEQEIAVPYIIPADAVKSAQRNYPILDLVKIKNK